MQNLSFFKLSLERKRQILRFAELAFKTQHDAKPDLLLEMEEIQKALGFTPTQILVMAQEKITDGSEE